MTSSPRDSFQARRRLKVGSRTYTYYSLKAAEKNGLDGIGHLPFSLKILLENLLRHEDGQRITKATLKAVSTWPKRKGEISFHPGRVLMQDFTGVPGIVDLAALRDALEARGGDPERINPLIPVDMIIDHSVMVDKSASPEAYAYNLKREFARNGERYAFLRWGAQAFNNFRVIPPGKGICHQINLEVLAQVVQHREGLVFPDTLVGTDSHTTMVNALSVLGWGVGGIEAEAAMLGQPLSMRVPEVVGVELTGRLSAGVTATDLVLTLTQRLRQLGVVGKFVEFTGSGLDHLSLEDRATVANMAPEYGATCGFFPIDKETLAYLKATGRKPSQVALVERYARAQGLFRTRMRPMFTQNMTLDLKEVESSLAGPRRPMDRLARGAVAEDFARALKKDFQASNGRVKTPGKNYTLGHGDVVIAAITSCTNTSNPSVMIGAGLLAQKAHQRGLKVKPWVKTSLAPGSQVVSDYLKKSGLQRYLNALGFHTIGYGCTTCIGNSGPLDTAISQTIADNHLVAVSVLSGNRNFEGRISPDVRANYLASPPLVVAYALAGSVLIDLDTQPLGEDRKGRPVYLDELWPSSEEIQRTMRRTITPKLFRARAQAIQVGDKHWRQIKAPRGTTYAWHARSTYVRRPPFFEGNGKQTKSDSIHNARILALLGDSITTDHISPAGTIAVKSPAGDYLRAQGVKPLDFNSYGSRRGNHEVMMRGTFGNIRLRNHMAPGREGGWTTVYPEGRVCTIYEAAGHYAHAGHPLVVFAGEEYGTGSSRDWAAKGTALLGIQAVIARSFERIHRTNLVGMGVLPLEFANKGVGWDTLKLRGDETVSLSGFAQKPRAELQADVVRTDGTQISIPLLSRIDTREELAYYKKNGIAKTESSLTSSTDSPKRKFIHLHNRPSLLHRILHHQRFVLIRRNKIKLNMLRERLTPQLNLPVSCLCNPLSEGYFA